MKLAIEFVNHASIIIEFGSVRILTDPWLFGSAFDDGWNLLTDTPKPIDQLDFTHIWLSHEHPDHFSPPNLQALPEERRKATPLLFQETADRKVENYCRGLGFPVQVLDHWTRTPITDEVTLAVAPSRGFDHWLMVEGGGKRVLNVNDCFVEDPDELDRIRSFCGELDLLALQFGYANWVCNPDSIEVSRAVAKYFLGIAERNVRTLKPTAALPFASYSYYSAEDNDWLNKGQATAQEARPKISASWK